MAIVHVCEREMKRIDSLFLLDTSRQGRERESRRRSSSINVIRREERKKIIIKVVMVTQDERIQ